jgi:hypothetical protein
LQAVEITLDQTVIASIGDDMETIQIAQALSIRDEGFDEYWLQDQIYENPACLGLGDLDALTKERLQSSGGRLDILLKNPEDDGMYEVEVMLGETDETHIIRTIEYWDNEKRRWPQRQHFAVLVAEHINRRFFNVIHLLSHSIPIIAVQVSLIESGGKKSLFFSKVLDTYEEIDDGTSLDDRTYNREFWVNKSKWTLETMEALLSITEDIFIKPTLHFVKNYISINVSNKNYFWTHKRSMNKSLLAFRMNEPLQDEVIRLLDGNNISYVRKPKGFRITVDKEMINKNREVFRKLSELVRRTWQSDNES